ncbi:MAG: glutamate racemase [Saprospiraceae bacterium]
MNQPIGIFDSGIGGLTVARAITEALPCEPIVYFGDTAHMPYGDRNPDSIRYYSLRIARFLIDQGCKMVVVACNTASSAAYSTLLDFFDGNTLFINVVDPLAAHVAACGYRKVGVIGTKATIQSGMYAHKLRELQPRLQVASLPTPLLAPMIESGYYNDDISQSVVQKYLSDPALQDIDALLLACTHYPLIRPLIEQYYAGKTAVLDSTQPVAASVAAALTRYGLTAPASGMPSSRRFFVSEMTQSFQETAQMFYGDDIQMEHAAIW